MITHLILLIVIFTIYLVPQAMIINGIWLSAQGSTEIKPDGTDHDSDMIFYKLAKFLNQKTMVSVFYKGQYLADLWERIHQRFPTLESYHNLTADQMFYWGKQRDDVEQYFDIKTHITTGGYVSFYREYSNYKFSKYIRKPIFGCVVCMSSFWGIFTFLIPGFIGFHFDPIIFAIYVPNTFCLAFLNYKIMKPL